MSRFDEFIEQRALCQLSVRYAQIERVRDPAELHQRVNGLLLQTCGKERKIRDEMEKAQQGTHAAPCRASLSQPQWA